MRVFIGFIGLNFKLNSDESFICMHMRDAGRALVGTSTRDCVHHWLRRHSMSMCGHLMLDVTSLGRSPPDSPNKAAAIGSSAAIEIRVIYIS